MATSQGNTSLPVELESHLHLAGFADRGGNLTERIVVQVGVWKGEDVAVKHIEHFPAEIQPEVLSETKTLGKADVLIVCRKRPYFWVIASHISESCRLGWKSVDVQKPIDGGIELISLDGCAPVVITRDGRTCRAIEQNRSERIVALQCHRKPAQVRQNAADPPAPKNVRGHATVHPSPALSPR